MIKTPHLVRHSILLCVMTMSAVVSLDGQGIRKHYTQLTEAERSAYVAALDAIYASGIVNFYADLHSDPDQDGLDGNNFNGPDTDSQIHRVTIFLPWHRQFTLEYEQELQAINPKLSIPYWDWTGDYDPVGVNSRSAQGPLWADNQIAALGWTDDLIGKYNNSENLDRDLAGILPTSTQKQNLLTNNAFNTFSNFRFELENDLHDPPHGWVGGIMRDMFVSPRDPAFFLHHSFVDYLWQLWTEDGHTVDFFETDMPTFDGTVPGFSSVDPDNIRNTVTDMGVFYGNPDLSSVRLHDYTVNNNHVANENFIYPDSIIVDGTFQMGNTAVAEVHSCEAVVMKAGFSVPKGARLKVGTDAFCSNGAAAVAKVAAVSDKVEQENRLAPERVTLKGFPNPFRASFTFEFILPGEEMVSLTLLDAFGRVVASPLPSQRRSAGEHQLLVDTQDLVPGIYNAVLLIHNKNERYVLRVVKAR